MTIWNDVEHKEWVDLSDRTQRFVERIIDDEIRVAITPDIRTPEEVEEQGGYPAGVFFPRYRVLRLDPGQLLPKSMETLKSVNPASVYSQRRFPAYIGVCVHESGHANYTPTKRITDDAFLSEWVSCMEEIRIEGMMAQRFPQYAKYMRSSIYHVLGMNDLMSKYDDPELDALEKRYSFGRMATLALGRSSVGIIDPEDITELEDSFADELGRDDLNQLKEIWTEFAGLHKSDLKQMLKLSQDFQNVIDPENIMAQRLKEKMKEMRKQASPCGAPQPEKVFTPEEIEQGEANEGEAGEGQPAQGQQGEGQPAQGQSGKGSPQKGKPSQGSGSSGDDNEEIDKDFIPDMPTAKGGIPKPSLDPSASTSTLPGDPDDEADGNGQDSSQDSSKSSQSGSGEGSDNSDSDDSGNGEKSDSSQGNANGSGEGSADSDDSANGEKDGSDSSQGNTDGSGSESSDSDSEGSGNGEKDDKKGSQGGGDDSEQSDESNSGSAGKEDFDANKRLGREEMNDLLRKAIVTVAEISHEAQDKIHDEGDSGASSQPKQDKKAEDARLREKREEAEKSVHGLVDRETAFKRTESARAKQDRLGAGNSPYKTRIQLVKPNSEDLSRSKSIEMGLRKAQYREVHKMTLNSTLPPGRFQVRQAMHRSSQIAAGQEITATPWKQTRRREVDNPPITLAVASDVSGSMGIWQREVSSYTWAFSHAVKKLKGKAGALAWNVGPTALIQPNVASEYIPVASAGGGSTGCPATMLALDSMMELSFGQGVRVLTVITDGFLTGRGHMNAPCPETQGVINALHDRGVQIIWVVTRRNGWIPKNTTSAVLTDPSDFGKIVGKTVIEALSKV